ncbi:MAG: VWA domain-containing protein [Myxococcales bacterium]|nr:VWA domain-containing protein [Myxococcales bacterium]
MKRTSSFWLILALAALPACTRPDVVGDAGPKLPVVAAQAPAPHLVALEVAPVDRFVEAGKPAALEVRVRLAVEPITGAKRTPANLALVVDTSGSMEGQAIADARAACLTMVETLVDGDRVAIVTFGSTAEVLVPSTVLDATSRAAVRDRIAAMQARGTTNMAAGLEAALAEVRSHAEEPRIHRMVVVSDGVPNDSSRLAGLAQEAGATGVGITTLGLGLDYDETLLASIAKASGGKFHFVRESAEVATLLEKEVLRMQRTVGRGVVLELVAGPGVRISEVVGYALEPAPGGVRVALGDVSEEETRDVIVKVGLPARSAGSHVEVLDAALRYDDAVVGGGAVEEHAFLGVHATADKAELGAGHDAAVELGAARASVASLVLYAIASARAGDLAHARATLERAEALAHERGRALHDAELEARAGEMPALRASLATLLPAQPVAGAVGPGAPMAAPPTPESAELVRAAHAAAVESLQGR